MKGFTINKKTSTKLEQLKLILSIYCLLSNVDMSETEITVLCYFILFKINLKTDELIVESKVVKHDRVLSNIKMRLCKKGFLKRNPREYKTYQLTMNKDISFDDNYIRMLINFDNR